MERCLSCGAEMHGPFCASCGQKAAAPIAVRRLVGEAKEQLFGLDFRIVRTVRELLSCPGPMLRGYLQGARIAYTNPLKLLFLSATLYLLVVSVLELEVSPVSGNQATATAVVALINYLVYLFLVPAAWVLKVLFRKAGYRWAECYVLLCYLWGGYLLIASAVGVAMVAMSDWYFFARTAAGLVYLAVALKSLFRLGWWSTIWRSVLFYVGYFLATFLVMGVAITLAHLVNFAPLQLRFEGSG